MEDFETLRLIGEGAYAQVYRVRHKATNAVYAMKVITKEHMRKARFEVLSCVGKEGARGPGRARCAGESYSPQHHSSLLLFS